MIATRTKNKFRESGIDQILKGRKIFYEAFIFWEIGFSEFDSRAQTIE